MDIIIIAKEIEKKIGELEKAKKFLKERSDKKAVTSSDYDRVLAITILKLRNGTIEEWEGGKLENLPATVLEKVAKGICFVERLEMDKAEADYKSLLSYVSTTESQLNGYQSINRHLQDH